MNKASLIVWEGCDPVHFQFSDNERENEAKVVRFLEELAVKIETIFSDEERRSQVLGVCLELLTNTCDHVCGDIKTVSLSFLFAKSSVAVRYSDSGDFFSRKGVKNTLEAGLSVASTRTVCVGGMGTQMLVKYASDLYIDTHGNNLQIMFE
ncbi:MAG: hypothetical protein PHT88_04545 [Candidatus Moranbacteria bacterium]|nr:hypothetical protein [Candidatus Moranbacteria bacterium]